MNILWHLMQNTHHFSFPPYYNAAKFWSQQGWEKAERIGKFPRPLKYKQDGFLMPVWKVFLQAAEGNKGTEKVSLQLI